MWSNVALVLTTLGYAYTYKHFQLKIPNGEMVPHPCKSNFLWRGVGHENHLGGGTRNQFGVDFKNNNYQWTSNLCQMDSDGDGKSNGEELGDPDCIWSPGTQPASIYGLSHPGICDPFDSPLCNGKPDFVDCRQKEFECDVISEEGVFNFTVRLPVTPVPTVETTYMCMNFRFPVNQSMEYHIVANVPYLDNMDVMHHMTVFGCEEDVNETFNEPYPCGMGNMQQCTNLIGGWTVGSAGRCNPKDAGYLISKTRGYRSAIIQYHWNNPAGTKNYTDSSGMTFYVTPRLRLYNAGMLVIGQNMLQIPPGRHAHEEHGGCSSQCLSRYLTGDIIISSVVNHMHYLGKAQITTLHRANETIYIASDEQFSYDSPVQHVQTNEVIVRPGDELSTTCVYKSTSRTQTTFFGEGTQEEMCLSFINYYPKENMRAKRCVQMLSIDSCEMDSGYIKGCDLAVRRDPTHSQTATITARVIQNCTPGLCRSECLAYVREVKKNPCYSGDVGKIMRQTAMRENPQVVAWYAAFDSCDVELLQERCGSGETNTATSIAITVPMLGTIIAFQSGILFL